MRITALLVAAGCVIGASTPAKLAAQVGSSNHRPYSRCEEVQVGGRWFNTFGEGRCPPGSRLSYSYSGTDVNAQAMRRTENSVQAIGQMQQSLLSLGRSVGRSYQAASDRRGETYAYHAVAGPTGVSPESFYAQRKFFYPLPGTVVYAKSGEPVLTSSEGYYAPCFIALDDGAASSIGGHHHHVRAGELVCKLRAKDSAYTPLYNNYSFSGGEMSMGQTLELKDGKYSICYRNMGVNAMCVKNIPTDRVVQTVGVVELKKTAREVATFENATSGKFNFVLRDLPPTENPLRSLDLGTSKSIDLASVQFDVLEASEGGVVLKRR